MSRKNINGSPTVVMEIPRFTGQNTALAFQDIDVTQSRQMINFVPGSIGSLKKRPGVLPLTKGDMPGPITTLTGSRLAKDINKYAVINNNLYVYASQAWSPITMVLPFNSNQIDTAQFKDDNANEVMIICDADKIKYFNGSQVNQITPAANDPDPSPANDLSTLHTLGMTGCIVHNTRVVVWNNTDTIWHSKIGYFDYFPQTNYQRFVRENDYVQTCVTYRSALLVFMRRHIGILFGDGYSSSGSSGDWEQDFLDTTDGCVNPRTVQTVTYPDGNQEVFYLSDRGVSSVYAIDTLSLDHSARYSTRSVTDKLLDWDSVGINNDTAVAQFVNGQYWLIWKSGTEYKGLIYDTFTKGWYPINGINADTLYSDETGFYFAGTDGHLKLVDPNSYDDWSDADKTYANPIVAEWYSKLLCPKLTGYDHLWDVLMIEAKQFSQASSIDVEVNTYRDQYSMPSAIKTEIMVWGVSKWGEAEWANQNMTDIVNNAKRLPTFCKGQYAQIKLSNIRNGPVEIYSIRYEVRVMDKYQ